MVDLPGTPLGRKLILPPQHPSTVNYFWPGLGTCGPFTISYVFLCRILDLVALEHRKKQYCVQIWNYCSLGSKCGLSVANVDILNNFIIDDTNLQRGRKLQQVFWWKENAFFAQRATISAAAQCTGKWWKYFSFACDTHSASQAQFDLITRCQQYRLVRVTSKNHIQRFPKDP